MDTGQDYSATTNPHVRPNFDGFAELLLSPLKRIPRVHWRQDLDRWSEQREIANLHFANIEHHAVEVEEDTFAEFDVRAVIAEEGWLHPNGVTTPAEKLRQNPSPFLLFCVV